MGSWNHTCAVSNLHVTAGTDVFVFLLLRNKNLHDSSFCYGNALYDVVPLPFYGKYDDYGGVEECNGFGLPIILDNLKSRLYKFGQGPNSSHDCEVTPENLTIEKLFEADHESRLGIQDHHRWDQDDYDMQKLEEMSDDGELTDSQQFELDRLASKIKKVDTFRQVTHVVIHGDIARAILEKWYIKDYVGSGQGTTGYDKSYNHIYFKNLIGFIPEYIEAKKAKKAQILKEAAEAGGDHLVKMRLLRSMSRYDQTEWNSPNLAARWMSYFDSAGGSNVWGLVDVKECLNEYYQDDDWDGMAAFTKEVLTAAWINSFMTHTRKVWTKQSGQGSQNGESLGYRVLARAMVDVLDDEERKYTAYNDPEDGQMELDI